MTTGPTRDAWLQAVAGVLKGAPLETLRWHLPGGAAIEPLYPRAAGAAPVIGRPPGTRWRIVQRVDHPDAGEANALALADLEGGADGLTLVLAGAAAARGFGLAAPDIDTLARALDRVELDLIALRLDAGAAAPAAAASLLALAQRRGLAAGRLAISIGYDPVGILAAQGRLPPEGAVGELVAALERAGHAGPALTADGRPYHEAGASGSRELAAVLASGLAHLRALEKAGLTLEQAARRIDFVLAADADIVLTISKLRALRRLWARVEAACGLTPEPACLHAETAWRMLTRRDPPTNMLRGTIAAFAAGLGGADSIGVLPFTAALGLPDAFARRVARNAQHVLMAEANLHRVADPAASAGTFEVVTDVLCTEAWAMFQAIERQGGAIAALLSGWLQDEIAAGLAGAPEPVIVGTTRFALAHEAETAVLAPAPPAPVAGGGLDGRPLPAGRAAEPFEGVSP